MEHNVLDRSSVKMFELQSSVGSAMRRRFAQKIYTVIIDHLQRMKVVLSAIAHKITNASQRCRIFQCWPMRNQSVKFILERRKVSHNRTDSVLRRSGCFLAGSVPLRRRLHIHIALLHSVAIAAAKLATWLRLRTWNRTVGRSMTNFTAVEAHKQLPSIWPWDRTIARPMASLSTAVSKLRTSTNKQT